MRQPKINGDSYTGMPPFILLCFTMFSFVFYKLKACCNSTLSKSIGAIFPIAFAHFASLYQIWVILTIIKRFHYYYTCYGDLCLVIFELQKIMIY